MTSNGSSIQWLWDLFYPLRNEWYFLHIQFFLVPHVVCLFFLLMDLEIIPGMKKKYAFRPDYQVKWGAGVLKPIWDNFISNVVVFFMVKTMTTLGLLDLNNLPAEAPLFTEFLYDMAMLLLLWEVIVYPFHRFQHTKWWYQNFHSTHHGSSSNAYTTMAGNLVDELISGTAIALPHIIYQVHPLSLFIYYLYFVSYGVAVHAGYNFVGCRFHFVHHVDIRCNYGGMFMIMDKLFGTYKFKEFPSETKKRKDMEETDKSQLMVDYREGGK